MSACGRRLGDGAGKGKYLATEATGASFAMLPRDDVALFLADACESDHWNRKGGAAVRGVRRS